MNLNKILTATLIGLIAVVVTSANADHPQVTINLVPDTEENCTATGMCVQPSDVSIDAGGEIILSNDGTVSISIYWHHQDANADPITLNPGQTFAMKFNEAGAYQFSSTTHSWMGGMVTVVGGDADHVDAGGHDESGGHSHMTAESDIPLGVDIDITVEETGGLNVHIMTDGFRWAPENVNGADAPGEGHAHLYVDGVKNRVYGPHYYINPLEPGSHHIRVTLNTNSHADLTVNGFGVESTAMVVVPEYDHHMKAPAKSPVNGTESMSVDATAHVDTKSGYNLEVTLEDFVLSAQNVNGDHTPGEGYVKVAIDGQYHTRLYENWLKIPVLEPGTHTIMASLFSNDHAPYHWDGNPIETSITVQVPDDGGSHAHESDSSHGH